MNVSMDVLSRLDEVFQECVKYLEENVPDVARTFRDIVDKPIRDGQAIKPIIVVHCTVVTGIKAPYKPSEPSLKFMIQYFGLDKQYPEHGKHLDRIFLRCRDVLDNNRVKPFISGSATKASLPIPQWVFRYTISHLFLEHVKLIEEKGETTANPVSEYVGIRMPFGTECFEYALPGSYARFYIYPDHKFWTYAIKNMNIEYLRSLLKEGAIIYAIMHRIASDPTLRIIGIGSTSRSFGTVEINGVELRLDRTNVTTVEWIRSIVAKLSDLKQMPKTKKRSEDRTESRTEQKCEQKAEMKGLTVSQLAKLIRQQHG